MIYEPMTFITDIILSGLAIYFGTKMIELYWQNFQLVHIHFGWSFYFLALGAFLGGISHGFGPYFSPFWKDIIWKLTMWSIGVSTLFMLLAAFDVIMPFRTFEILRWIPTALLVIYIVVTWRHSEFINVIRFYVPSMVFVLVVMLYLYFAKSSISAGFVFLGIIISFIGAGVQVSGFSLHTHFNHNDLYHVIQMGGLWLMYWGVKGLSDFT